MCILLRCSYVYGKICCFLYSAFNFIEEKEMFLFTSRLHRLFARSGGSGCLKYRVNTAVHRSLVWLCLQMLQLPQQVDSVPIHRIRDIDCHARTLNVEPQKRRWSYLEEKVNISWFSSDFFPQGPYLTKYT